MRELKRKKDGERPIDSRPQAPVPLGAGQKSRSAFSSLDQRSPDYGVRRLTTLLGVARMLTSELDLAEIVRQVLVRAIEVIPAADAGTLYLAEPETGRLIVSDSVGFGPSIFNLSLEPGEAAAGRAFVAGRGAIYPDPEAVQEALANAKPETYREFRKASLRSPKAAMAAPLIFKGTRLGALVVDALLGEAAFTPTDLAMLEDFAQIAAIAIVNAQLYGSEHTQAGAARSAQRRDYPSARRPEQAPFRARLDVGDREAGTRPSGARKPSRRPHVVARLYPRRAHARPVGRARPSQHGSFEGTVALGALPRAAAPRRAGPSSPHGRCSRCSAYGQSNRERPGSPWIRSIGSNHPNVAKRQRGPVRHGGAHCIDGLCPRTSA